ncbi:MAG: sugar MFS transporter [Endozoicomonas sp.]|uniref:sugar MFS transporter n=1 Tax=Endozoicomonas sp. TaxID=1892382 RepID=UPI003D9B79D3
MSESSSSITRPGSRIALGLLCTVFFTWGFLTSLNSILIPHLQNAFELSYTESMLIQVVFSSAPVIISLPSALLIQRIGYRKTLIYGLLLVAMGAAAFYPATEIFSFPLVLLAVLIIALGVGVLQVAANPYVAKLGNPETVSSRLTMASGINSLGTTVAPYIGAVFLLSATGLGSKELATLVQGPYLYTALSVLILAAVLMVSKIPEPAPVVRACQSGSITPPVWKHRNLMLGLVAIFAYCGAEVSVGNFLVGYLSDPGLGGYERSVAGKMVALYWGGAMVGRLLGGFIFQVIEARKVLILNAVLASVLIFVAILLPGNMGGWALLAVGLCNSIMYPVIFTLSIKNLGERTEQASGLLIMAGIGGAIIPLLQALVADNGSLLFSLVIPVFCYGYIVSFGWRGSESSSFKSEKPLDAEPSL